MPSGMLNSPLAFGLLAMVAWGVWSVVAEVATDHVSPEVAMVVSYATGAAIAFGYVLVLLFPVYLLVVAVALSVWLGYDKDATDLRPVYR